jgi:beta-glucosidase
MIFASENSITALRPSVPAIFALVGAALILLVNAGARGADTVQGAWTDRALPAEQRARSLVAAMTLDEKLQLVHGLFPPKAIGQPGAPADIIPSAGHVPGIPRLGIPALRESDASLGVANLVEQRPGDVATALPAGLATAASFDPALAYAGGAMIGAEARAKTFNVLLAGGMNLTRDPWNGRDFEYLGEDPLLAGTMAGEAIRGVQSNHIVSTAKHFALNAQETGRNVLDARIDEAALRESDLLAFRIAIDRGAPGAVMCAYNRVNDNYACESEFLLNRVLKDEWGYRGWVMSDWGAVHSTERAALAGLDQESGQELDQQAFFAAPLQAAVAAGRVPAARLDDMVRRILYGIVATGLYDDPVPAAPQPIDYDQHADLAQRVAEQGVVLLKNDKGLLPLARTAKRIVLIGGYADIGVLSGGGSSQVRSVGGVPLEIPIESGAAALFARITYHDSPPLKAIRALAPEADIRFVDGGDAAAAAAAAREADIALVFATQWQTEAQDGEALGLPDAQDALIEAVAAANPRTAIILETGGPVLMPWLDKVGAVLEAWYPGQRGGEAIAAILFGTVNPSGRLPITFPRTADQPPRRTPPGLDQLPAALALAPKQPDLKPFTVEYVEGGDVGYRWYEHRGEVPLFAFGYGLSYTSFSYGDLEITRGDTPKVTLTVTNTGDRAGIETPQLYVAPPGGAAMRLAGWQRLALKPGEAQRITIECDPRILADFDAASGRWLIRAGTYGLTIGRAAGDPALTGTIILDARLASAAGDR